MSSVYKVTGINGQLVVYKDKIVITRKGALGFISFGAAGSKTIPISSVRSVQYKAGSIWLNGYIQFGISGGREFGGGVFNASNDENTVMLKKGPQSEIGAKIKKYVENRIIEINTERYTSPSPVSVADEILKLKQLLDMEAITQEEFDKKKKQLLEQ